MKRAPKAAPSEVSVTDGRRPMGHIIPKAGGYEAFTPEGAYIAKFHTIDDARRALFQLDQASSKGLARVADDGGVAA